MPSEMDESLARHRAALLARGGPFELATIARFGTELPLFANAPPSLGHYFARWCAEYGDRCFLVDGQVRLSFAETHAAARALAGGLIERHGVKPGDRIGLAARNSANWIVAFMAILMAGGCASLLNGWWTGEELAEGVALAECTLVLADPQRAARLGCGGHDAQVLAFSHDAMPAAGFAAIAAGPGTSTPLPEVGPDDLATILFTSGSTGRAKGVVSDHRAVLQAVLNFAAQSLMTLGHMTDRGEEPKDPPCALLAVPLFHVTGEAPLLLQSFLLGRRLVLQPKWDPLEAMRLMNWKMTMAVEAGELTGAQAGAAKSYGTETHIFVQRKLTGILGAAGRIRPESPGAVLYGQIEQLSRQGIVNTFGGGVNEVLRDMVAVQGLGLPRVKRA